MSLRPVARALGAACLVFAAGAAHAAPAVTLRCDPARIQADENGAWVFALTIRNDGSMGAYGDSLVLEIAPDGSGPVRTQKLRLPGTADAISAGDSVASQVSIAATAARARLTFRWYAHAADGGTAVAGATLNAAGSVLEDRYPATVARVGGRDVEMVKVPAEAGAAIGAGVLLLAGEDADAREQLVAASRLAGSGLHVVIVNAPGRGRSTGAGGGDGAAARAGALAAYDTLARMPGVDRARLGAWGVSLGGTVALRLAIEKPARFHAVVVQAARYDGLSTRAIAATKVPILVLHGEKDGVNPSARAHAFADAVLAAGGVLESRFPPNAGHTFASPEAARFLRNRLTSSP